MATPTAPPPPELIFDAITEILLRLPPDEPACLVRASLVCKLWRHILSEPTFPQRYREFHRTPPLLGFLRSTIYSDNKRSRFVPIPTRTPFLQPPFRCRPLDCRHGRVLLDLGRGKRENLAVWDPATDGHKLLADPDPKSFCRSAGAVLCAAADCNHRGCHGGGPFIVVLVSTSYHYHDGNKASAWVYSSDRGAWSAPASVQIPAQSLIVSTKRGALVGDRIYFLLVGIGSILEYDFGKHCSAMICVPHICPNCDAGILMSMEDSSSLGLAAVKDSTLHLWARKLKPNGYMGWVKDRVISLNNTLAPMIPAHSCLYRKVNVIGFAEGLDILLLGKEASGFMFELKSGRFKKLSNHEYHYYDVYPYLSFYIPDFASHKSLLPVERTTR